MTAKRVLYFGHVQGVGFRYTAHSLARNLPVTGFVRNLPDGSVELVAEGEPEAVADYLDRVERAMQGYIHHREIFDIPVAGYRNFWIRRDWPSEETL
ncbi:MAG: acylphosphatase [Gemmatales bacterium]|nr:acylphosphatase [Gemmatales bacterium]MDW8387654.1 acylphosphatase [Gemmatales bacterium]